MYPKLKLNIVLQDIFLFCPKHSLSSDKIPAASSGFVRSCLGFRQNSGCFHGFCPKLPRVRTKFRLLSLVLSEVALSSDKIPAASSGFVRSCLGFGQNSGCFHGFCPKLHRIRTKFRLLPLVLSEVASGLDKISAASMGFVRSCLGFRQNSGCFLWFCPKLHRVRTKFRLLPLVLSEVASGSDKISAAFSGFVRSCLGFGQNFGCFHGFCPKLPWVQTKFRLLPLVLSEVALSSDKIPAASSGFVRSCLGFGQNSGCFLCFCPKLPQVRTKIPAASSDFVRSCLWFGHTHFTSVSSYIVRSHTWFGQLFTRLN